MISKLYKMLWSRIGGRQWTYIARDYYHQHPMPILGIVFGLGIAVGHIFWGDKYPRDYERKESNGLRGIDS